MVMMSQIKKQKSKDIKPKGKVPEKLTDKKAVSTGKMTSGKIAGGAAKQKCCGTTPMVASTPGLKPSAKLSGPSKNPVIGKGNPGKTNTVSFRGNDTSKGNYKLAAQNVADVYARRSKQGL